MQTDLAIEMKAREGDARAIGRVREFTRRYAILTSSLQDEFQIMLTAGLPRRWDAHPADNTARCIHLRPEMDHSNPLIWWVYADYTTDYILEDFEDPSHRLPEVEWEFEERQVIVPGLIKDKYKSSGSESSGGHRSGTDRIQFKAAPTNSAGQPFDPPPLYDKADPVLIIDYVDTGFDEATALQYVNSVNSDSLLGADPGQLRCKIRAKRFQWRDQLRWNINIRLAYRAEGWQPQILDQGAFYLDTSGAGTKKVPFTDRDGNQIIRLLDGLGQKLNPIDGDDSDNPPVFLTMPSYPDIPFAPLGIDSLINKAPQLNQ